MSTQTQGKQTQWLNNSMLYRYNHKQMIVQREISCWILSSGQCPIFFCSNAGYQCTANALAALIFSSLYAVSEWRTYDIDQILLYCDLLFLNVKHDRYQRKSGFLMALNPPRFANYIGLSLRIWYQFDMMHGVSRNRLDDTEFFSVSIQEGVQSRLIVSHFLCLHWMISLWHLFIIQHIEHTLYLIHIPGMLQGSNT